MPSNGPRSGTSVSTEGAIAFFLPSLCGGGAERVVVNLAHSPAERTSRLAELGVVLLERFSK